MTSLGQWHGKRGSGGWGTPYFGSPFSSDLWNPREQGSDDASALSQANVDWRETDKSHIFTFDLPGVRKEHLKVQVEDDNILQISGDRVVEKEEHNDKWHRVERSRGSFSRRFRLPENANVDAIKCGLDHGVLKVEVPKKEVPEQEKNVRSIEVA